MAAIELLKADVGRTLVFSLLIGTGAFVISGPLLCYACPWWRNVEPASALRKQFEFHSHAKFSPRFAPALLTVLLPVLLILCATTTDLLLPPEHPARKIADALGTPLGAMLLAVLVAYRVLGTACGFDGGALLKFTGDCMAPIAPILLVIGAGSGFSKVMTTGGVGDAIAEFARHAPVSPLIYGWLAQRLSPSSPPPALSHPRRRRPRASTPICWSSPWGRARSFYRTSTTAVSGS
jgi:GntP family gluconate:H+ symporter